MQHEAMLNELMELILSGDPVESDIHQLYAGLQPHLQALADWLHVAKTDIRIEIQPNVYEIRGRTETFGNTYHDEIGGEPLVLTYPHLSHIVGTAPGGDMPGTRRSCTGSRRSPICLFWSSAAPT